MLQFAFPKHKDIFLHEHSTLSNLRTFSVYKILVSNLPSVLLFCQFTQ